MPHTPQVLIILDGFGHSHKKKGNAIYHAKTPYWDNLQNTATKTLLSGAGHHVGLPAGQMGNSEVGHLNIGAGRIVKQNFSRIQSDIDDNTFINNQAINDAIDIAKKNNKSIHVLGLLSPGGVHSHEEHIHALFRVLAEKAVKRCYLHAFLDGRDTPPRSAAASIQHMEKIFSELGIGCIATLVGRYWAMDRDQRWERVQAAYELLAHANAPHHAETAIAGLETAYARDESDEFVSPTVVGAKKPIEDGDVVIFMNYRADRAREITNALTNKTFTHFQRTPHPNIGRFVMLTEYDKNFDLPAAYPPLTCRNVFGETIAKRGLTQLRIAETEKYAHVTFFFNGGVEQPFENESRWLIPSPKVATYDLMPEMSAPELTDKLIQAILKKQFDVVICNFANPDMVGHTGNFHAAIKAVECVDTCLEKIGNALQKVGGEMLITADHGNVEKMQNEKTGQAHTAHTSEPVPFVYVGRPATIINHDGRLCDIAPTMLMLLGIPKPADMTGSSLLRLYEPSD